MQERTLDTGSGELLCSIGEQIATVTLNRPEKRNALSHNLTPALRSLLLQLEADADVRVVVLTGAGNAFCAGGDVSRMGDRKVEASTAQPSVEDEIRSLQLRQEALSLRLYELAKPTIAALPGVAAGAGLSIALACDIRIASQSSFITTAFANIGLSGDYGGSWLLSRLVGSGQARELYFTSRRVPAVEAMALGIFNRVVPDDLLAAEVTEMARSIAAGPPIALRFMKENFNRSEVIDLRHCLAMEADRTVRCMRTDDHKEAILAFIGKRKPVFNGR